MRKCFRNLGKTLVFTKKGTLQWNKKTLASPASNLLTPCFPILVIDHRIFNSELYLPTLDFQISVDTQISIDPEKKLAKIIIVGLQISTDPGKICQT